MTAATYPEDAIRVLNGLQLESFSTDTDRYAAKEAARKLLARLETPFERSWALSFETPVLVAGLQVCQDLGIWSNWSESDKGNPGAARSLDEILAMADKKVDPNLLRTCLPAVYFEGIHADCSQVVSSDTSPPCMSSKNRGLTPGNPLLSLWRWATGSHI